MQLGFWEKLEKPIMCLAPMADVTDAAFRRIIAKYGKPDVMWTEFVSCDGLCSEGKENLLRDFWYTDNERPIVAQIFGANPETFYKTAQLVQELGFDGIDINMGCPEKNICKQGAGSALIQTPKLAQEIIKETMRGAGPLPVSVKTRLGYNNNQMEEWVKYLLDVQPAVLTMHARTKKEMSKVDARWDEIANMVELGQSLKTKTLLFGNGDVKDLKEAQKKVKETGVDGVMLGRAIFGNPWLFNKEIDKADVSFKEQLQVMVEHTYLFEEIFGDTKNFSIMKKHYKAYVQGFSGASKIREQLMQAENASQVENILKSESLI